jgi:hypothetical protein
MHGDLPREVEKRLMEMENLAKQTDDFISIRVRKRFPLNCGKAGYIAVAIMTSIGIPLSWFVTFEGLD